MKNLFPAVSPSAMGRVRVCGRAAMTGTLVALLAGQPLLAEAAVKKTVPAPLVAEMQGQERVLHALNRLTFGPRPGDVGAVQAMGLNKWLEAQLNPGAIDDSALEAKLAEYPAMNLPLSELQRKFPAPQTLKAIAAGKASLPSDPVTRAMVIDQLKFYEIQRKKAEAAAPAPAASQGMGDAAAAGDMAMSGATVAVPAPTRGKGKGKRAAVQAGMDAMSTNAAPADGQTAATADKPIPASELAPEPLMPGALGGNAQFTRADADALALLPPNERMTKIMALSPNQLARMRGILGVDGAKLIAGLTPEQKEMLVALPGGVRMIALESMESRLMRDIYSNRQLEAVMTDFWLNHFNVYVRKNQNEPYLLPAYERETIRPRALGNFEDLLVATARSPAMLVYLDNFRSVGPDSMQAGRIRKAQQNNPNRPLAAQASAGLNENYGRELMELHTLGVNGGYTQADVTMVAKVFTGWGLDKPYQGGDFQFEERRHEPGAKTVLGTKINEAGEKEGLEVLHMLATSPATAHFISEKLAVRFVSDDPAPALVDRMAASFLKSNGDIKTVLRTMFASPEFWATGVERAKVKTPEEFVISAVRASGAQVVNPASLVQSLDKLGMPLYGMATPNGYSWKKDDWVSTGALVSRMNFSLILAANRLPGVRMDWTGLLGGVKAAVVPASYTATGTSTYTTTGTATGTAASTVPDPTAAAKEKRLEMLLLGQPVSDRTRATVIGQSNDQTVTDQAETQFDLGNGAGGGKKNYMPRGMRAGPGQGLGQDDAQAAVMAGLLLGSPEFQRR